MYSFELCIVPRCSSATGGMFIELRAKLIYAALYIVLLVAWSGILSFQEIDAATVGGR